MGQTLIHSGGNSQWQVMAHAAYGVQQSCGGDMRKDKELSAFARG
ncbi:hypothetical protein [Sinorhizobium medicae]|nr:hypothetical protein [Sinorhizobium medicae]